MNRREFLGSDPATVGRLKPYFEALKSIGYTGGVSCECGWGELEKGRLLLQDHTDSTVSFCNLKVKEL